MSKIPVALTGWRIVVIDDEFDNLDIVDRLLRRAGADVQTAENGRAGFELVRSFQPDFILSDLSMPVLDGWQLKQMLDADAATSAIPVIALTAHAMPGDKERALDAGFVNYITKPLDVPRFVQDLRRILKQIPQFEARILNEEGE